MGLHSHARFQGRGREVNFWPQPVHGGGIIVQTTMFRPVQSGTLGPPVRFSPGPSGGVPLTRTRPPRFNFRSPRHAFGRFQGKHFRKNQSVKNIETQVNDIDLKKPWVTEEIRNEITKCHELFELWKKSKSTDDWTKYEVQKQFVQELYEKVRVEYVVCHPNEAALWENASTVKRNYCETCDKSFRTSDDLLLHETEHETCGREGCEFTAHPKIIAKHIKMQHETGLYKRIGKLYTAEDISKWIEERKKRYPTKKVVEEKKILEQEKLKRGEKIKEDDSKFNKSFTNKGRGKKKFEKRSNKNNKNKQTRKKKHLSVVEKYLEEDTPSIRKGVLAFSGIKTISESVAPVKKDFDISDDEWETENKSISTAKPTINSSLGLLAMSYNSDAEISNNESHMESKTETMSADEDSGPDEASSKIPLPEQKLSDKKVPVKRKSTDRKDHQERKKRNSFNESNLEKKSSTLLEKLLKNEIRHERNVILQCVHYVVKNNFFKT